MHSAAVSRAFVPQLASIRPKARSTNVRVLALESSTSSFPSTSGRDSSPSIQEVQQAVFGQGDTRDVVLHDGFCNLCSGGVDMILAMDTKARLRLSALQSETGRALLRRSGRRPDDISSIVLVTPKGHYIRSEAILRIGEQLPFPWAPMATVARRLVPLPLRDALYDIVADNRYRLLGQRQVCRIGAPRDGGEGSMNGRFVN